MKITGIVPEKQMTRQDYMRCLGARGPDGPAWVDRAAEDWPGRCVAAVYWPHFKKWGRCRRHRVHRSQYCHGHAPKRAAERKSDYARRDANERARKARRDAFVPDPCSYVIGPHDPDRCPACQAAVGVREGNITAEGMADLIHRIAALTRMGVFAVQIAAALDRLGKPEPEEPEGHA